MHQEHISVCHGSLTNDEKQSMIITTNVLGTLDI
ncbi:hypothetical protein BS78_05G213300 [Paspalum vaginatum]|nr:hypothetical protein BS78_05G213300 [Paspalum vaginatum]